MEEWEKWHEFLAQQRRKRIMNFVIILIVCALFAFGPSIALIVYKNGGL